MLNLCISQLNKNCKLLSNTFLDLSKLVHFTISSYHSDLHCFFFYCCCGLYYTKLLNYETYLLSLPLVQEGHKWKDRKYISPLSLTQLFPMGKFFTVLGHPCCDFQSQSICKNSADHELFDFSRSQNYFHMKNEKNMLLDYWNVYFRGKKTDKHSNLHEKSERCCSQIQSVIKAFFLSLQLTAAEQVSEQFTCHLGQLLEAQKI